MVKRKKLIELLVFIAAIIDIVSDPLIIIKGTEEVGFYATLFALIGFISLKILICRQTIY